MEYTQFGRTAMRVSKISYGTWQFGGDWGHVEREQWDEGKATVRKALELGINFFDTAQAYGFGLAERLLGEALQPELRSQRHKIMLATKGGLRMDGSTLLRDGSAPGIDQVIQGMSGLMSVTGSGADTYRVGVPIVDIPSGMICAFGIVLAMRFFHSDPGVLLCIAYFQRLHQSRTQSEYGYRKFDCLANLHSCHPDPTNGPCSSNILSWVSLDEQQVCPATRLNDTPICESKVCSWQDCGRTQCFHRRQPCLDQQP